MHRGAILAAAIGVHDDIAWHTAPPQRHAQRVTAQLRRHASGHRPAHDGGRVHVDDHRKVQPAFVRPQVGDVFHPLLIRRGGGEILLQKIRCPGQRVFRVGGRLEFLRGCCTQPLSPKTPGHGFLIVSTTLISQIQRDTRCAIAAFSSGKRLRHLRIQIGAKPCPRRRRLRSCTPSVKPATRHVRQAAHRRQSKGILVCLHKRISHFWCLAK